MHVDQHEVFGMNRHDRIDFDSVPIIDFGGMLTGNPEAKAEVAAKLRNACSDVGFFYITNHEIGRASCRERVSPYV